MMAKSRTPRSRGSALITALLVILVLTVIGIGLAYFTQIEDRMSGNERLVKSSFFAAEAGLRAGEEGIKAALDAKVALVSLLGDPTATYPVPGKFKPPGGGRYDAVILRVTTFAFSRDYAQIRIATPAGVRDQAYYSLYVRNNDEDPSESATVDKDSRINLIAVGVAGVVDATGAVRGITKILEEQITLESSAGVPYTQKGSDFGGTGTVSKA